MGFLESARQGGSEELSFAIYLVKNGPILVLKKKFGAFGAKTS